MDTSKLMQYVGYSISDRLENEYARDGYLHSLKQLHVNYGDNVDFQRLRQQILLCDETSTAIYAPPAPIKYKQGMRPYIDGCVDRICDGCKSDRERVLALLVFCRELCRKHDNEQLFYGGNEEELIKKGERLCECLGRLVVSLAEVCGIPGRIVFHVISGHITAELYFEGKWAYVDPRFALFYLHPDGSFASVLECMENPSIMRTQPETTKSYASDSDTFISRMKRNTERCLSKKEVQCFCDYSLTDADKYNFDWVSVQSAQRGGLDALASRYRELSELYFMQGK